MTEVYSCQVEVLDGSTVAIDINVSLNFIRLTPLIVIFEFQKRTIGEVLLTEVFKHLGLEENDYFGLQFLDSKDQVVR
jgi:hypothetical protein